MICGGSHGRFIQFDEEEGCWEKASSFCYFLVMRGIGVPFVLIIVAKSSAN